MIITVAHTLFLQRSSLALNAQQKTRDFKVLLIELFQIFKHTLCEHIYTQFVTLYRFA